MASASSSSASCASALDALEAWFTQAAASGIPDLQTFADALCQERDARHQALVQPYSNGISEGFANKIKVLKRQRPISTLLV